MNLKTLRRLAWKKWRDAAGPTDARHKRAFKTGWNASVPLTQDECRAIASAEQLLRVAGHWSAADDLKAMLARNARRIAKIEAKPQMPAPAEADETQAAIPVLAVGATVDIPYGRFLVVAVPSVPGLRSDERRDWSSQCVADVVHLGPPQEPENAGMALAARLDALLAGARPHLRLDPWTMINSPVGLLRLVPLAAARRILKAGNALTDARPAQLAVAGGDA